MVRTPSFQKYAGRVVASYISDKMETTVRLEKIRITDGLRMELKNLTVDDRQGNPLLTVSRLELGTRKFTLRDRVVGFNYLRLEEGLFSLAKYKGDSVINLAQVLKPLGIGKRDSAARKDPWRFECADLQIDGLTFLLRNENRLKPSEGITYHDMEISNISLGAKNITVIRDSVTAEILSLSAKEKSGINLRRFNGMASVSRHQISVNGLEVDLNESVLDLDIQFLYTDYIDFKDFINKIYIQSTLRDCNLNSRDIGYFAPKLLVMDNAVSVAGQVRGTVSDFSARSMLFSAGYQTHFDGDIYVKGLPDIYNTEAIVKANVFEIFPPDIASFALPGKMTYIPVPEWLEKVGLVEVEGNYRGRYNDFALNARVNTELGKLDLDIQLDHPGGMELPVYAGDIRGENIDLGSLTGTPDLGSFDIEAEIQGAGLTKQDLEAFANLWIDNLYYKGHHYDKVVIGGDFTVNTFAGRCLVFDESLKLSFDGLVDFSSQHPRFNFSADVQKARFYELNLSDRGKDMELKGSFFADFTGIDPDSFSGIIKMDSLRYVENGQTYYLNSLELNRQRDDRNVDVIRLRSDYADADARGDFSVKLLIPQLRNMVLSWYGEENRDFLLWEHVQTFSVDLRLKNTEDITDLFLKDLRVSNDATLSGSYNSTFAEVNLSGNVDYISYKGIRSERIDYDAYSTDAGLIAEVNSDLLFFNKSSAEDTISNLGIENLELSLKTIGDSISYLTTWDDGLKVKYNSGRIEGFVKVPEEGRLEASITSAEAMVNGENWLIDPDNYMVIDSGSVQFTNLKLKGFREKLLVNGRWSPNSNDDTLKMVFDNWALNNFSPVYSRYKLQMDGRIEGSIGFSQQEGAPKVFSDLGVDSLEFNNTFLGQTRIKSYWIDEKKSLVVNMQIMPTGRDDEYKVLNVSGFVFPLDKTNNYDLDIVSHNLQVSVLSPFMKSFSSGLKGVASGYLHMGGPFRKPALVGEMKLQRAEIKIDYLNVTYTLSNDVIFTEDAITFNDVEIYDEYTNKGVFSGTLKHEHFKNMQVDLTIKPENLLALNLGRYDNDIFYGTAFATGEVKIYGPFKDISIDLDVTTGDGTNVYIPLNYTVDVSQSDFLVFVNSDDSTLVSDDYRVVVQGFKLNMGVGVQPEAYVQIFLPSNMGSIRARGEGDLRLGVDPRGYLTINGHYYISSGLFTFSLEQLVSKRFEIVSGSSIRWDGDLNSAEVNISANYRTKTSLNGLGITMLDPSSVNKKVNVVVKIFMSENLFNPNLRFSVAFPNLDEQTRQTIYAVLDTTDMAIMNQQAISLLILNSFTYTGSGTNPINSTALLANSLSSMLSSISNNFDIGINYIPGDNVTSEEVEVALSTQLFDDRLSIDGNIGVSSERNTQNTSSIVGDVQIEYKLTRDGRFRVKAFNRANDISIINNDVPYTQGVGIFYRKDFDNIKELFSRPNRKKNREKK